MRSAKGASGGGAGGSDRFFQLRHGAAVGFALQRGEDRQTGRGQLDGRYGGFAHKATVDQQRSG